LKQGGRKKKHLKNKLGDKKARKSFARNFFKYILNFNVVNLVDGLRKEGGTVGLT
jgi:hypothetical protein